MSLEEINDAVQDVNYETDEENYIFYKTVTDND